jgi:hypothetical protein
MAWNGYRDAETDVGKDIGELENCSLFVKGECVRRLGFGAKIDLSGAVTVSAAEVNGYAICATAAGAVLAANESSSAVTSLTTGLSTTNRPTFATVNGRLFYSNGSDAVKVIDNGTAIRNAGITAPTVDPTASGTSSGGVVDAGVHLVRYRYYDSTRNRLSNASDSVSVTITAGQKYSVGVTALTDAAVDKIIIEITAVDGTEYYRAAIVNNTTASNTIDISDEDLVLSVPASRDGEDHHGIPPTYGIIAEHKQRLWLWSKSNAELSYSRAFFPESCDSLNYAFKITLDDGDTPSACASFYSDLYLFGQRSIRRLIFTGDPAASAIYPVPGGFGVFNPQCLLRVDGGAMFGWGINGAFMISSMQPKKISLNIDATIASLASTTTTARFMAYEPTRREVAFFFPLAGETYCKSAAIFAIDSGEWTLWKFRQPMSYGVLNSAYLDRQRLMLCDANGYAWRVGVSTNDGASDGSVTATSGSTTTVVNCVNTATPGQIAYVPSTGEERLITVATGSAITVSPALSTAPSTGTVIYIGSIRQRIASDWDPGEGINDKKRPTKLLVAMRPEGDMGEFTVNYYTDFSVTKEVVSSFASDTFPEGVSIANNQITVDADVGGQDGYIPVPAPSDWKRVIKFEVVAEEPLDGIRFIGINPRNEGAMKDGDE